MMEAVLINVQVSESDHIEMHTVLLGGNVVVGDMVPMGEGLIITEVGGVNENGEVVTKAYPIYPTNVLEQQVGQEAMDRLLDTYNQMTRDGFEEGAALIKRRYEYLMKLAEVNHFDLFGRK